MNWVKLKLSQQILGVIPIFTVTRKMPIKIVVRADMRYRLQDFVVHLFTDIS